MSKLILKLCHFVKLSLLVVLTEPMTEMVLL